jgi:DNA-directed RNA polymerase subunit RPC12/RpoP
MKEKIFCPKCGSQDIINIVYGYPLPSTTKKAERGEIFLGGCCVSPDNPDFKCRGCGKEFLKREVLNGRKNLL